MMHSPSISDFPLFSINFLTFWKNFKNITFSRQNFPFSSAKISDDFFFSHRPQISDFPPIFPVLVHFPPDSQKFIISPLLFKISPLFSKNSTTFDILYVYFSPTLTMMHLCITQCTYWTPLIIGYLHSPKWRNDW